MAFLLARDEAQTPTLRFGYRLTRFTLVQRFALYRLSLQTDGAIVVPSQRSLTILRNGL